MAQRVQAACCRILLGHQTDDDHTADEAACSPMKVCDLLARPEGCRARLPDCDCPDAQSLWVVNPRPGFGQPLEMEEDENSSLTEHDQEFGRKPEFMNSLLKVKTAVSRRLCECMHPEPLARQ